MKVALAINLITAGLLLLSFFKSSRKTLIALKMSLQKGANLMPWMIGIIVLIGMMLSFVPEQTVERYLGGEMTLIQVGGAALLGTITMIPSLIAVPLAGSLIEAGASYTTIAAFLTTLIMVGFVTLPLEIKELGIKITFWRNLLAFIFAIIIAGMIGVLM